MDFLQERVLGQWDSFTIWNAGKQGRKLYRGLSPTNQKKVCSPRCETLTKYIRFVSGVKLMGDFVVHWKVKVSELFAISWFSTQIGYEMKFDLI